MTKPEGALKRAWQGVCGCRWGVKSSGRDDFFVWNGELLDVGGQVGAKPIPDPNFGPSPFCLNLSHPSVAGDPLALPFGAIPFGAVLRP